MDAEAARRALESFDPTEIPDPILRERVCLLSALAAYLLAEVERLRHEIALLRGERQPSGREGRGGGKPPGDGGASGEGEAQPPQGTGTAGTSEPSGKPGESGKRCFERPKDAAPQDPLPTAKSEVPVHLVVSVDIDRATLGGPGWHGHGAVEHLIQDVLVIPFNILFICQRMYSATQGKTVEAPLPPGYDQGRFGPNVKELVLQLGHECRVPEVPLWQFLAQRGTSISQSTVGDWLSGERLLAPFHAEAQDVFEAGMAAAEWTAHDVTSTRVNGVNWACHGLSDPWFSSFFTLPGQDRRQTLRAFQGGKPLLYRLDAVSDGELEYWRVSQRVRRQLREHLGWEQTWTETEFEGLLAQHFPGASDATSKRILDAAARAAYWQRSDCATPQITLKDDASAGAELTEAEQVCWWHEARHYEELTLVWPWQEKQRDRFLRCYWKLYRQLDRYRQHPTLERARILEGRFERLFRCRTGCSALDHRIKLTGQKQERLLTVLRYPAVPLHNNGQERALRSRARKRDVSYGTRSESGVRAWDTMQGLSQTTQKLGIRFSDYLRDRLLGRGRIPRLADLITNRSPIEAAPTRAG